MMLAGLLNIQESHLTSHDLELEVTKVLDSLQPVDGEVRGLEASRFLGIVSSGTRESIMEAL